MYLKCLLDRHESTEQSGSSSGEFGGTPSPEPSTSRIQNLRDGFQDKRIICCASAFVSCMLKLQIFRSGTLTQTIHMINNSSMYNVGSQEGFPTHSS